MKKISLGLKLSLYSIVLVLAVAASVGTSLYLTERGALIGQIRDTQVDSVHYLVYLGRKALLNAKDDLLTGYLGLIRQSRVLSYALVLDTDGRILAHSNGVLAGQKPADDVTRRAREATTLLAQTIPAAGDEILDYSLAIFHEGRRIGTARVGYSQQATHRQVDQTLAAARLRIGVATAAALAIGVIFGVGWSLLMAMPLQRLRDAAREIGAGALDHRIEITSRDELGDLARDFNSMAAKLQELDRLKQDFVSNVTHELRSPLTSLRGYVEFLLRGSAGPLNNEQVEYLIVVKNNAVRLARFIDHLLDVAKIEAGRIELHREYVALPNLFKEIEVVFRPTVQEKKIAFRAEAPDNLPPLWADADKILEVFTNLASNALKFTPDGGNVTLTARREGDAVHAVVSDTGCGIPAESLGLVFNKFEQVKPTRGLARKTKGTGLGLTIVKGFVEAHGGRVWLESAEGRGTEAHVTLPLGAEAPHELTEEIESESSSRQ
jgi:signal transduction histidine kinase